MFPNIFGPQVVPKAQGQSYLIYSHNYMGGAWTAPDPPTVDQRGALLAQNMQYYNRQTQTRFGWGIAITLTGQAAGQNNYLNLFNWLSDLGNYLVWMGTSGASGVVHAALITSATPTDVTIGTLPGTAPWNSTWAQAGPRLYQAGWNPDASGGPSPATNATCITENTGTFSLDSIIPGPPSTAATGSGVQIPLTAPTEPGGGIVTQGLHNIGLRMLHRSGFLGRPGPDSSTSANPTPTTFAPIQFTSAGGKNLQWAFTPVGNWPADVVQVQMVMAPVKSPNRLFVVPGAVQNVTGGAATPVSFTINIDDGTLVDSAATLECTDSLNFYTASATGQAFMQVSAVAHIGTRMFYVSTQPDNNGNKFSVVFASDPGQYQNISLDQHMLQLPNQVKITTVFGVQGSIYIAGPHWTYVTQDTGDVPIKWPTPTVVDNRKGVLFPNCIEVNVNGLYAWVADKTGLYYFNGAYSQLPVSWQQRDLWSALVFPRFNMTIKDDSLRHIVTVLGTKVTNPTQGNLYTWDYTNGIDPYSVRFSLNDVNPTAGSSFGAASIEIVQNDIGTPANSNITGSPELWMSPGVIATGTTQYFSRIKNPAYDAANTLYQDDSGAGAVAIHTIYEPPIFPVPGGEYNTLSHQGSKVRITGSGTMQPKVYTFDKTSNILLWPSGDLASATDGKQLYRGYLIGNNGFVYHFEQQAVGSHFTLSEINMYYSNYGSLM